MGTRSPSWAPGLIDRGRQRVRGIAFERLTFKASQVTNLWLEEWRHAARPQARKKVSSAKEVGAGRSPGDRAKRECLPPSIVRKLQIVKLRGQASVPGLHTFRITHAGLQTFSRILGLA
jgi:hypothetical protein